MLFVMDGWYEWKDRQPYVARATLGDTHVPLVVAGLCRPGRPGRPTGAGVRLEATMVTTASAGPVGWLHDRMPRLLGAGDVGAAETLAWLYGSDDDRRRLAASPPTSAVLGSLGTREADRRVGDVGVNGPELIAD